MLGPTQARRYTWVDDDRYAALTIAVVAGRDRDDVIRAYGGDPEQPHPLTRFDDAYVESAEICDFGMVQVRQEGVDLVVIENNGWLGQYEHIAQRASSDGGHFISAYWTVNSAARITQARDGELLAHFRPLDIAIDPNDPPPSPLAERLDRDQTYPEWIADVQFTFSDLNATMLAVVEEQSGLAFDPAWLDTPMPTYRVAYPKRA